VGCHEGRLTEDFTETTGYEVTVCPDGTTLDGIDVSYWQGSIDWASVAGSGLVDFAFIRVSDGLNYYDTEYQTNWAQARSHGIVRGTYQYFRPGLSATDQANLLLSEMGTLQPGDLPPVLDVETSDGYSQAHVTAGIHEWIDVVEAAIGCRPIIYSSPYLWQSLCDSHDFVDYPLWIAHWGATCPDVPDPWTRWEFWQTSDCGSVSGISGCVDTNVFNGGWNALADAACDGGGGGDADGDGYTTDAGDCDDGDASIHPGASETCDDGVDQDCDGADLAGSTWYYDNDGDGYGDAGNSVYVCGSPPGGTTQVVGDCNDGDASVHPGAAEVCDHLDNDCDGIADEGLPMDVYWIDADADGYGDPASPVIDCAVFAGHVDNELDCDDADPNQYPGAPEVCNYEDDDCDGEVDEGVRPTFYWDGDLDGWCNVTVTTLDFCSLADANATAVGGQWGDVTGDCDDENADIHPDVAEVCDGVDNDCDGVVDDGTCTDEPIFTDPVDGDGDGFVEALGDCDDGDWTVYPGAEELCDGVDNDCDGKVDEDGDCQDADGDGYSPFQGDCDDANPATNPAAEEVLEDGRDNDCDGEVDEDPDRDFDLDGYSESEGDCNDGDDLIHPGALEDPYDMLDNDCDGIVDESIPAGCSCATAPPSRAGGRALWLLTGCLVFALCRRKLGTFGIAGLLSVGLATGCAEYEIQKDQTPPVVDMLVPGDGQRYISQEPATAMALVHDREDALEGLPLTVTWMTERPPADDEEAEEGESYISEVLELQAVDLTDEQTVTTVEIPPQIEEGIWSVVIRVTDSQGLIVEDRASVATIPNEPPTVRILEPEQGSTWSTSVPVLLLAEVTDDHLLPRELSASWCIEQTGEVVELTPDDRGQVFTIARFLPVGPVTASVTVDDGANDPVELFVDIEVTE